MFHVVNCLLGCPPQLSNYNNQPSTSSALLRHDYFNVLTNFDFVVSIPTHRQACV